MNSGIQTSFHPWFESGMDEDAYLGCLFQAKKNNFAVLYSDDTCCFTSIFLLGIYFFSQHGPVELSTVVEMFCVCAVQYGSC